jgi:NADPH:quinone reductase
LKSGAVCVPIAETYPLERAPDAYDRFTAGGKFGKVVLAMFT